MGGLTTEMQARRAVRKARGRRSQKRRLVAVHAAQVIEKRQCARRLAKIARRKAEREQVTED